jgi:hypothetical protein
MASLSLLVAAVSAALPPGESQGQDVVFGGDRLRLGPRTVDERELPFAVESPDPASETVRVALLERETALRSVGDLDHGLAKQAPADPEVDEPWFARVLPHGIIYRSYWAGLHEPRVGVQLLTLKGGESYWDPTLGARIGLFRYGNDDALHPQGWQLDVEGAAMARLTLDYWRDFDAVDFRGGVPLTYGIGNWQFKLAYYHLSSHLGDEFALRNPGSLNERVNYVRDAVVLGASWFPVDFMRTYAEVGYAFNATGGAQPLEFQFGAEWSDPGVTDSSGTPFAAINVHLREEHEFGGDINIESGWLWRDQSGHSLRVGAFYFQGKSSQYQFYNDSQVQLGGGVWYDF